ncbi:fimbrial protein [Yersinia kristensenii]|uniref:F4 family fimbrial subunit n=1 Tax=Yersinia kristensenii TaxID=28152 RepID=UPI003896E567
MKKTLIAMAVAASAAISGSAMAWTANGSGGNVDLGGTITPVEKVTPWEVQVGAAVTDLDADIQKGQQKVDVAVNKPIPVLGIRTIVKTPFAGKAGINPTIDYKGAINTSNFSSNKTDLTLDVLDTDGAKIGTLSTKLAASGVISRVYSSDGYKDAMILYSEDSWGAFDGGLSATKGGVDVASAGLNLINELFPGAADNFDAQGTSFNTEAGMSHFGADGWLYSGAYASGIRAQENIKITLDNPAGGGEIIWKASLPVTVTYI